jgi:hypothetical protein
MPHDDTERPSWLLAPCPSWCAQPHTEDEAEDDRRHQSEGVVVPVVMLIQDVEEVGGLQGHSKEAAEFVIVATACLDDPDIWIYIGEAEGSRQRLRVSVESVRRLMAALQRHLDAL